MERERSCLHTMPGPLPDGKDIGLIFFSISHESCDSLVIIRVVTFKSVAFLKDDDTRNDLFSYQN